MKKIALVSIAAALLLLTGCSQKRPQIDMTKQQQAEQQVQPSMADSKISAAVSIDDAGVETSQMQDKISAKIAHLEAESKIIYFDFDRYNIKMDQKPRVEYNAELFNSEDAKDLSVKIEGNCDEWGTDEYNYALGLKRAKTVKNALNALGVSNDRMLIVSYGESNPACTEHERECWRKNRRAEFKLLP
jgi:peptidoglycan-associated lipoprotein